MGALKSVFGRGIGVGIRLAVRKVGAWIRGKRKKTAIENGAESHPKKPQKPRKKRVSLPPPEADYLPQVAAPVLPVSALPRISPIPAFEEFSAVQLSAHTKRAYKKDLQDFFAWSKTQGIWEFWNAELSPVHIARYRDSLTEQRKLAKGTVTRKIAVLKSFFKWAKARGWIDANPAELVRAFPQTQDSKTSFLSEEEIHAFLGRLERRDESRLSRQQNRVVIETLLMLGLRRSEASAIRAGDLEWSDGRWLLKVKGKGDRERRLPLPPKLLLTWSRWWNRINEEAPRLAGLEQNPGAWMDWLKRHAAQPLLISTKAPSFDVALAPSDIARVVRRSARLAGLPQRVHPHMLRATAITQALDAGATHRGVQQMAGWTSPLMITRYDKKRMDPRYSAIHFLKYAQVDQRAEAGGISPQASDEAAPTERKQSTTAWPAT